MKSSSLLPTLWRERAVEDPFRALRRQIDEVFDGWATALDLPVAARDKWEFTPRCDVSETEKEVRITVELPGVDQKDVEVALSGDLLTIKGEKNSEKDEQKEEKGRTFHRLERSYGSFQRSMTVPFELDPAKVDAQFKDGVLTVTLPKAPEVQKQTRKIEVKSEKAAETKKAA